MALKTSVKKSISRLPKHAEPKGATKQQVSELSRENVVVKRSLQFKNSFRFYFSAPMQGQLLSTKAGLQATLGKANYSYAFAMAKFKKAFCDNGLRSFELTTPVIHRDGKYLPGNDESDAIHLAFYPPEDIRLLKGARNILCFAWEFSTLRQDWMVTSAHAFASQLEMMKLVSEIWTPSTYAAEVIRRDVEVPVLVIPAPIDSYPELAQERVLDRRQRQTTFARILTNVEAVPLAIYPPVQEEISQRAARQATTLHDKLLGMMTLPESPVVYLTVANPHDARKGLRETIEAFVRFAQVYKNAILIIKTSSPDDKLDTINTRILTHQLARQSDLVGQYFSPNILITNAPLDANEMQALFCLADYYICTSYAEGQNFPLQEAMATGAVPISVDHTAMRDYIFDCNSLRVPSKETALPPEVAAKYTLFGAKWYQLSGYDLYRRLFESIRMSRSRYHMLSENAVQTIESNYSAKIIMKRIETALEPGQR